MGVDEQFTDSRRRVNEGLADHVGLEKFWFCLANPMFKAWLSRNRKKLIGCNSYKSGVLWSLGLFSSSKNGWSIIVHGLSLA